jgi:hypothetical protein
VTKQTEDALTLSLNVSRVSGRRIDKEVNGPVKIFALCFVSDHRALFKDMRCKGCSAGISHILCVRHAQHRGVFVCVFCL